MELNNMKDVTAETVVENVAQAAEIPGTEDVKCEACGSLKVSPELMQQAAQSLMSYIPATRSQIDKLTGVQAKAVLKKLIESPLEDTVGLFTTREAARCFDMASGVQNSKHILFLAARNDVAGLEKQLEQAENEMKEKDEENGS